MLEQYHAVIQDQLASGVVELAESDVNGREFYIPHKAVVREAAESTKLRIIYDASAKAHDKAPSLTDCLNPAHLSTINYGQCLFVGDFTQ